MGRSDGKLLGYTLGAKPGVLLGGVVKQIHVGERDGIKLGE